MLMATIITNKIQLYLTIYLNKIYNIYNKCTQIYKTYYKFNLISLKISNKIIQMTTRRIMEIIITNKETKIDLYIK